MAREVGFGLDAVLGRADHHQAGALERLGDVDQRHALFARRHRAAHPVDDDVGAAAGDHLLGSDVRTAGQDGDVQIGLVVKALGLGDDIAGELGLGDPLQLQRDVVSRLRGKGGEHHGSRDCTDDQFLHVCTFPFGPSHRQTPCLPVRPC